MQWRVERQSRSASPGAIPPTTQHLRYHAFSHSDGALLQRPADKSRKTYHASAMEPFEMFPDVPCIRSTRLPPSRPFWLSRPAPRCNGTSAHAARRPFLRGQASGQGHGKWDMSSQAALTRCDQTSINIQVPSCPSCVAPRRPRTGPYRSLRPLRRQLSSGPGRVPTWVDGRASHVPVSQPLGMSHEGVLRSSDSGSWHPFLHALVHSNN